MTSKREESDENLSFVFVVYSLITERRVELTIDLMSDEFEVKLDSID